jgi:hypothetical protein
MSWIGWVSLFIGLIVIGYAAMITVGALYPSRLVMITVLKKELEKGNINQVAFSEPCIKELADFAVKSIERDIKTGLKKGPLNSYVEEEAVIFSRWIESIVMGDDPHSAAEIKEGVARGTPDLVWFILAKYDPDRFSLEHLQKMQATNSLQRNIHYGELAK